MSVIEEEVSNLGDRLHIDKVAEHRKGQKDQEATNVHEPLNTHEEFKTLNIHEVLHGSLMNDSPGGIIYPLPKK
jgi:hypothetical protein